MLNKSIFLSLFLLLAGGKMIASDGSGAKDISLQRLNRAIQANDVDEVTRILASDFSSFYRNRQKARSALSKERADLIQAEVAAAGVSVMDRIAELEASRKS